MMETKYIEISKKDFTLDQLHPLISNNYYLNKNCIIFNKIFTKKPLEINVSGEEELFEKNIDKINKFLNWIGNNCKDKLIESYCEIISSLYLNINFTIDALINLNWYDELEVLDVNILLSEGDTIYCNVHCSDNIRNNEILFISFCDFYVNSIEYEDKDLFEYLQKVSERIKNNESIVNIKINNLNEVNKEKTIQKNICSIHNCTMKKEKLEIYLHAQYVGGIYGYNEAKHKLFLNCDDRIEDFNFDIGKYYELKYVCKLCNKTREEWVNAHRSHICFQLNTSIKENIIVLLNNEIELLMKKLYRPFKNYWITNISLPNGIYNIIVQNKISKEILFNTSLEINNERIYFYIDKYENSYNFKIERMGKVIFDAECNEKP